MSYVDRQVVTVTTDASGDSTDYTAPVNGRVQAVHYIKTDFDDGADFTITSETSLQNIWVDTNINASETVAPRISATDTAGAAVTYDGTRPIKVPITVAGERIKIVVAQGGDTKTGTFYVDIG